MEKQPECVILPTDTSEQAREKIEAFFKEFIYPLQNPVERAEINP